MNSDTDSEFNIKVKFSVKTCWQKIKAVVFQRGDEVKGEVVICILSGVRYDLPQLHMCTI